MRSSQIPGCCTTKNIYSFHMDAYYNEQKEEKKLIQILKRAKLDGFKIVQAFVTKNLIIPDPRYGYYKTQQKTYNLLIKYGFKDVLADNSSSINVRHKDTDVRLLVLMLKNYKVL